MTTPSSLFIVLAIGLVGGAACRSKESAAPRPAATGSPRAAAAAQGRDEKLRPAAQPASSDKRPDDSQLVQAIK